MRICDNGKYRDLTPSEETAYYAELEDFRSQEEEAFLSMPYPERVERLIRERYTVSDELAILRQKDEKPEEYAEYYAFAEDCKARARVGLKDSLI